MTLVPFKFVVAAVLLEQDEDGNPVGETTAEPVTVFGCDALARWAAEFPVMLEQLKEEPEP